jgi:hypothetical protein
MLIMLGSRPLISFCEQLANSLQRYRALSSRKAFGVRNVGHCLRWDNAPPGFRR